MNQFSSLSLNFNDNDKSFSEDNYIFFNYNTQKYSSLFENPLQSSHSNFPFDQQLNDQDYQTQQQCFDASDFPLKESFQFIEQPQCNQNHYQYQNNSKDQQLINQDEIDFFEHLSQQQDQPFIYNYNDEQQKQQEFQSNINQLSENDDNLQLSLSRQSNNLQNICFDYMNQNSSSNIKPEEISQQVKQQQISSIDDDKKKSNKKASFKSQEKHFEKSKQSICKNNIRNLLTPIVRMRYNFMDYKLLEKEKISLKTFQSFLKQHFYIPGKNKLKIRQAKFDSLLSSQDNTQIKERRVFAQIVIRNIQNLFMNLMIEKNSTFNNSYFYQQFDWINRINESLVVFLNSFR